MDTLVKEKLEKFFSQFPLLKYKKGQILIMAGDDPGGIYFLKEGTVKMYAITKDGSELVLNIFKPYSFFPMSWAVNNAHNTYYYEAISPLTVHRASKDKVLQFIEQEPAVVLDLLKRVYKGTDGLLSRMEYLMSGTAYTRLITEIIIVLKRFGEEKNGCIQVKYSQKDLALQTGMTRETISREMKILIDKKLLTFQHGIISAASLSPLEEELAQNF